MKRLETCAFNASTFTEILAGIQKLVDELNLQSYSNLVQWVGTLDQAVEEKLAARLEAGIIAWAERLQSYVAKGSTDVDTVADSDTTMSSAVFASGGDPEFSVRAVHSHSRVSSMQGSAHVGPYSGTLLKNLIEGLF